MNVTKLRAIQKAIREEPRKLQMEEWFIDASKISVLTDRPPCGTAACIAGLACILDEGEFTRDFGGETPSLARDILDLTEGQSNRLFFTASWPMHIEQAYKNADSPEERAEAACAAIDWLIENPSPDPGEEDEEDEEDDGDN